MDNPTTIADLKVVLHERGYEVYHDYPDNLQIILPSEYIVSVAWGDLNYCTAKIMRNRKTFPGYPGALNLDCQDAELAVWTTDSPKLIQFEGWEYDTKGWTPVPEILEIIDYLAEVRFLPLRDGQCFGVGS